MTCFLCFACRETNSSSRSQCSIKEIQPSGESNTNIAAETFTFRKLATMTKNFRREFLIGEGGFGRVYRGKLDRTGEVVAVKQLHGNLCVQGKEEFLSEVSMLSHLQHKNLVNLLGYCADGDQRFLVHEFMQMGSLKDHLHDISQNRKSLDWATRMKAAFGVAQGLEYLHDKTDPALIYSNLKASNVLLDQDFNAKLSDLRVAKPLSTGHKQHETARVMGMNGYCAPEYQRTGKLTIKSDVYSFGVMMLELISGRRAIDLMRMSEEQNLVTWAQPMFRDPSRFPELVDPILGGDFPVGELNHAVATAAMCLQEEEEVRPLISDVVNALSFLGGSTDISDEAANFHAHSQPIDEGHGKSTNQYVCRNLSSSK